MELFIEVVDLIDEGEFMIGLSFGRAKEFNKSRYFIQFGFGIGYIEIGMDTYKYMNP